jgi:hypothetical protein
VTASAGVIPVQAADRVEPQQSAHVRQLRINLTTEALLETVGNGPSEPQVMQPGRQFVVEDHPRRPEPPSTYERQRDDGNQQDERRSTHPHSSK